MAKELSKLSPSGAVSGPACIPIQADVASKKGCDDLAEKVKAKESELDILVRACAWQKSLCVLWS